MKKNKSYTKVVCNVLLIRLLFSNILLNLIQQRQLIKDHVSSDSIKRSFAEYGMNVFRSLLTLHRTLLPFDAELGSLDLKEGSLYPTPCDKDVKPGESVC